MLVYLNVATPILSFTFFPTVLAVGGTDKHNVHTHTHVNTLLFTGWELKAEKTTESGIPL